MPTPTSLNTQTWLQTRAAFLRAVEWLCVYMGGGKLGLRRQGDLSTSEVVCKASQYTVRPSFKKERKENYLLAGNS